MYYKKGLVRIPTAWFLSYLLIDNNYKTRTMLMYNRCTLYVIIHVPSMLAKSVKMINKQTSSHNSLENS